LRLLADVMLQGTRLRGGSPALRNDRGCAHVAAAQDVHALAHASDEVRDDGVFMLAGKGMHVHVSKGIWKSVLHEYFFLKVAVL